MLQSMYNLDHRLAELRPSPDEQRTARQQRDAAFAAQQPIVVTTRRWFNRGINPTRISRVAAS